MRSSANHLDPARTLVQLLGGAPTAAARVGVDESQPYRWMYASKRPNDGNRDGIIPPVYWPKIRALVRLEGFELEQADFARVPVRPELSAAAEAIARRLAHREQAA